MKKISKIVCIVLALATVIACAFAFTACGGKGETEYAAVDATDLLQEDFGIAIKKGNTTLMTAVNAVIDEWNANGNMTKYLNYYDAVASETPGDPATTVPDGLNVTWDFTGAVGTIDVYTESGFAPYEFVYNSNVIGLDIAIMSQVAKNANKSITVHDIAFDNIPTEVASSTNDAVGAAGLTIKDERKVTVDFSNVYSSSTLVVVSAKGSGLNSVASLAGKKVGVQQGTSGDLIITSAIADAGYTYKDGDDVSHTVKAAGATVSQYSSYALVIADLKAGRIDAILMDKIPALLLLKSI